MEYKKNSSKILNLQSCGTNTNFECCNCIRKNDFNYCMPPPFQYFQHLPSYMNSNIRGQMVHNESVSAEQSNSCQNSKLDYGLNGSFFSPFPIYLPLFYNPLMFTSTNQYSNCSQSTQTEEYVSVENNNLIYERNSQPKLNYENTKKIFSRKSSCEDNKIIKKSQNYQQDRGDNGNDIDESEFNSIKNIQKDKFIRIREDKNSYYERVKNSSEDDDSYDGNDENINQIDNSSENMKSHTNEGPKFCPPVHNDTAALCMLSLLTRHKTVIDMAQSSTFPQMKADSSSRVMKKSEIRDNTSENYLMSSSRNSNIHKVPNALQQNDHLKAGSPRSPVKLRQNPNLNNLA